MTKTNQHIDLTTETPIPINQAPKHYPAGRPNISTVYRHFTRGVRGAKLDTFVEGGRRYTTIEAIRRFVEQTTANSPGADPPPSRPTNRQREASISKAEAELDEAGIYFPRNAKRRAGDIGGDDPRNDNGQQLS